MSPFCGGSCHRLEGARLTRSRAPRGRTLAAQGVSPGNTLKTDSESRKGRHGTPSRLQGVHQANYSSKLIDNRQLLFHFPPRPSRFDFVFQSSIVNLQSSIRQPASLIRMGNFRIRFPVAAKIALHTAGAVHGTPGSPMPPDFSLFFTMCTSTSGASFIRTIG